MKQLQCKAEAIPPDKENLTGNFSNAANCTAGKTLQVQSNKTHARYNIASDKENRFYKPKHKLLKAKRFKRLTPNKHSSPAYVFYKKL